MRVHFIGICGTAMATLAAMLKHRGLDVCGSDRDVYPPMSEFLAAEDIPVLSGYHADHVTTDIDLVIVGNAISRGNPELEEVLDRRIRYCSLPEAIRDHFLWESQPIVIAGTHGKTTTTALTAWVLADAGLDPSMLAGGIARNFGEHGSSYRMGRGRPFVIEGDEYDSAFFDKTAKFLKYLPESAVIGNVEFDHADIYADVGAVVQAFQRFVNLLPRRGLLLLGADSPRAIALAASARCRVQTFGVQGSGFWVQGSTEPGTEPGTMNPEPGTRIDWQAGDVDWGTPVRFNVRRCGSLFGRFELPLFGAHNVRNALAAIAIGADAGIEPARIASALARFGGVKRRMELVGTAGGVSVYDDFAHHPTAVAETLAGIRAAKPSARIWAVFEPRSASSCRRVFQEEFAAAFDGASVVIIAPVYRASLPESERLSVPHLVRDVASRGVPAREARSHDEIIDIIVAERRPEDVVVMMSNGGFGGIHARLLEALAS